jgi:hypothetical protein
MAFAKFALFTFIGCGLWCAALTGLGYGLGSSYSHILKTFNDAGYLAAAVFVVGGITFFVHRLRTVRQENVTQNSIALYEFPTPSTLPVSTRPADKRVVEMSEPEIQLWVAETVNRMKGQREVIEAAGPYLKAMIAAHRVSQFEDSLPLPASPDL